MFVKFLTGTRAGEIHEMKFVDAQALLADGRAEMAYQEPKPAPPAPRANDAAPANPPKAKKKKR